MKRQMKKLIVSAVALSLVIPALSAPKAEAAKKPSLVKKVSVKAGKTKKVTVKGVKTKQIKPRSPDRNWRKRSSGRWATYRSPPIRPHRSSPER